MLIKKGLCLLYIYYVYYTFILVLLFQLQIYSSALFIVHLLSLLNMYYMFNIHLLYIFLYIYYVCYTFVLMWIIH